MTNVLLPDHQRAGPQSFRQELDRSRILPMRDNPGHLSRDYLLRETAERSRHQ